MENKGWRMKECEAGRHEPSVSHVELPVGYRGRTVELPASNLYE